MSDPKTFADPDYLPCIRCGYDLRAARGEGCPECGMPITADRSRSLVPWAHRQSLGRLNAFVRTVWLATMHPARLAADAARPQRPGDAHSFHLATSLATGTPGVAAIVGYALARDGLDLKPLVLRIGPRAVWPELILLSAVVLGWVMFSLSVTGVQQYWFHLRRSPDSLRSRAAALGAYTSAAWGFLIVPLSGLFIVRMLLDLQSAGLMTPGMITIFSTATILSMVLIVAAVVRSTWVVLGALTPWSGRRRMGLLLGLPAAQLALAVLFLIVLPGVCLLGLLMVLSLD